MRGQLFLPAGSAEVAWDCTTLGTLYFHSLHGTRLLQAPDLEMCPQPIPQDFLETRSKGSQAASPSRASEWLGRLGSRTQPGGPPNTHPGTLQASTRGSGGGSSLHLCLSAQKCPTGPPGLALSKSSLEGVSKRGHSSWGHSKVCTRGRAGWSSR